LSDFKVENPAMLRYASKNRMNVIGTDNHGKGSVLISGASTGLGLSCAQALAEVGYLVFAGVRSDKDAEKLASLSPAMVPVRLDITDPASIRNAVDFICAKIPDRGLNGLINNAGIVVGGSMEFVPLDALRKQFEVNFFGHVATTRAFLPLIRKARGRIINMGSVSGLVAFPFMGPYCASKFAMEAFTDALRMELKPWGIHVSIIEPGSIATPIWDKALLLAESHTRKLEPGQLALYEQNLQAAYQAAQKSASRAIDPKHVVAAAIHALTSPKPRTRYVVGQDARRYAVFRWLPDPLKDWLIARKIGLISEMKAVKNPALMETLAETPTEISDRTTAGA
jgi:NAD(P)-dependent dehydrogenase (short-subunit alcohol dehydrogenase family)